MRPTLILAVPPRLPANVFLLTSERAQEIAPMKTVRVSLNNPWEIITKINELVDCHQYENVQLKAVVIGVVDWLSLREWANDGPGRDFEKELFGCEVLCDPRRDAGAPMPIYSSRVAVELYAEHRAGSEGRR